MKYINLNNIYINILSKYFLVLWISLKVLCQKNTFLIFLTLTQSQAQLQTFVNIDYLSFFFSIYMTVREGTVEVSLRIHYIHMSKMT